MMKPRFLSALALFLILNACSFLRLTTPIPPTPYDNGEIQPPTAAIQAQTILAGQLGIPPEKISIREITSAEWSNSCLDAPNRDELCTQQLISGYRVVLAYGDEIHIFHTDLDGVNIREIQEVVNPSEASKQAHQLLAGLLGLDPLSIRIVSEERVRFSDSCLAISTPETICAQVQVWGTRVKLEANGVIFEFRSAEDPIEPVLAAVAGQQAGVPILMLSRDGGLSEYCDNLHITLNGTVIQYSCRNVSGSVPGISTLSPEDQAQLLRWVLKYMPFNFSQSSIDEFKSDITFNGLGNEVAQFEDQMLIQKLGEKLFRTPSQIPTPISTSGPG